MSSGTGLMIGTGELMGIELMGDAPGLGVR